MKENQLVKLSAAALLGKATIQNDDANKESSAPAPARHVDDDVAGSGCCGSAPAPAHPAQHAPTAKQIPELTWYVRDKTMKSHGPIPQARMILWWRYHMFNGDVMVSNDNQSWTPLSDHGDIFVPSKRIEMIDPTAIPDL